MIEVNDLVKSFGTNTVLNGITFTANKGEITCLIGVNGSGKTTILNAIMGLTPYKSGNIHIDGKMLHKKMYEKIAYIPDTMTMVSTMKICRASCRERVKIAAEEVEMKKKENKKLR